MYGMELLATLHWVTKREPEASASPEVAARMVRRWSRRKTGSRRERSR